ncbi:HNH endonuclease signature motif containing protein [Ruegeria sp. HKCCD6109]|uniref:HNH endonuclease signature motif containing protein n=1 Tax=Ruegeria sp. HKCCD6109 TaxID=2683017 RepID=UPI0014914795|nr:HNH endonuclease signature motif containing protein [Ruegeria sp. HKCCD6109]NOD65778.1 hypothetical protein [Ruegeria sp. HKCCD6109]
MAENHVTALADYLQYPEREIWRHVPSEPGVLASSHGRILQAPCNAPLENGGFRSYKTKPRVGSVCKSHKQARHQYYNIMLRRYGEGNRQAPRKVHQLVCEAFHGPKPFEGAVVIHKDENALNNRPENLRWGTQKENMNAPGYLEYCRSKTGENSARAKGRK